MKSSPGEEYMLATGDAAIVRLRLLDEIFGPATREFMTTIGLRCGWRVADIGCGIGLVALWIAEQVGRNGCVSAVDLSFEQLRVAKSNAAVAGLKNISFHQASAYETGLPAESFDLVYSRFLMCHLQRPIDALKEMVALLKKGGVLVCEDCDDSSIVTDPPTRAYTRLVEISRAVDAKRGLDSKIGLKLHRLFREAGFRSPKISLKQMATLRGPAKQFWELTLREAAPAIIEAGAASAEELDAICAEMQVIARDETTLVVLPRFSQVCLDAQRMNCTMGAGTQFLSIRRFRYCRITLSYEQAPAAPTVATCLRGANPRIGRVVTAAPEACCSSPCKLCSIVIGYEPGNARPFRSSPEPDVAAYQRAVRPLSSRPLASAPRANNNLAFSNEPLITELIRGVPP